MAQLPIAPDFAFHRVIACTCSYSGSQILGDLTHSKWSAYSKINKHWGPSALDFRKPKMAADWLKLGET